MILYPAIDIQNGMAVRLRRGDFADSTVFSDDPVALALQWQEAGAETLHVVDLDAARTGEPVNFDIIDRIVHALDIPVQYGGGIRNDKSLALVAGTRIRWAVIGTAAITDKDFLQRAQDWLQDRFVVGVDCDAGMVSTHGWQQRSQMTAVRFVQSLAERGVRRVVYTDVTRDGMMMGPNFEGLREVCEAAPVEVILSGGISCVDDLRRAAALEVTNLVGVIAGRALYDGSFTVAEGNAALG